MNKLLIWAKLPLDNNDKGYIWLYHGINMIGNIWADNYTIQDTTFNDFLLRINNGDIFLYVDLIKDYNNKILYTNQGK